VSDKPDEDVNHQDAEYDGSDPEAPILVHKTAAHPNERHSQEKTNAASNYVEPALHWLHNAVLGFWEKILKNATLWTVLSTVAMAVATSMYTCYARRQWKAISDEIPEVRKSAKAANTAAETARDTLIASNRPWLDVRVAIVGPLTFDDLGAHLPVLVETTNVGHSPAIRVASTEEFIQELIGVPNPWQEIKRFCEQAGGQSAMASNRGVTQTIFVGRPQQQRWTLTPQSSRNEKGDIPWRASTVHISSYYLVRSVPGRF